MVKTEKILTDSERLEIAMNLLDERQLDEYIELCSQEEKDSETTD